MSRIVTFYSYKGGVGRTFALANVAALLARRGKRILLMDWDLEAPGLHRYFAPFMTDTVARPQGLIHLLHSANNNMEADWQPFVRKARIDDFPELHIVSSGDDDPGYSDLVSLFSWRTFFEERRGATVLDRWRQEWKDAYDFILIDSRTGITDTGGICTVFLPEFLVLVFSANEQSVEGGKRVAAGAQLARRELQVPRPPLAILPIPGRFDGRDELDEANRWLERFALDFKPFYDDWLPKQFQPRDVLEVTKIPYITKFSFGEPLPVVSHSVSDPELPGFYLDNISRLLASDFGDVLRILPGGRSAGSQWVVDLYAELGRVSINEDEVERLIGAIESISDDEQLRSMVLREAGDAFFHHARLALAEAYLRRALALSSGQMGVNDPSAVAAMLSLANVLRSTKRIDEAEALYLRALAASTSAMSAANDSTVINLYNNLADLYREAQRPDAAEAMYKRAIQALERSSQPDQGLLEKTFASLASLLADLERFDEAEITYRRIISSLHHFPKTDDSALAVAHNNLATLHLKNGRLEEARETYLQLLNYLQNTTVQDDSLLANVYMNLSSVCRETSRYDDAESYLHLAIGLLFRFSRPGDPPLISAYNSLAALYLQKRDIQGAAEQYWQIVRSLREDAREDDPAFMAAYYNLVTLHRYSGRPDLAEAALMDLICALRNGEHHTDHALITAYENLATLYIETGRDDKAEKVYVEILSLIRTQGRLSEYPDFVTMLVHLAEIYRARKDYDRAEFCYREGLPVREGSADFGVDQLRLLTGLGQVLFAKGELDAAESTLRLCISHPEALEARETLAKILEDRGNLEEANALRQNVEFDIVVSYNKADLSLARQLVRELETRRLRVWMDEKELFPGDNIAEALLRVLGTTRCIGVCVGKSGVGNWESAELQAFLQQRLLDQHTVVPILLPGAEPLGVPEFLQTLQPLDLRDGISKLGIDRLARVVERSRT